MFEMSPKHIAEALGLIRAGRNFIGACPACNYPTGFSLKDEASLLIAYCHAGGCSYKEIITALQYKSLVKSRISNGNIPGPVCKSGTEINRYVFAIWESTTRPAQTIVQTYLQGRGYRTQIPKDIRYHHHCQHSETNQTYPAMIAAVRRTVDSQIVGIHRTFLAWEGTKAAINPNKKSLGSLKGASVHLGEPEEELGITEGIETGLSVLQATKLPVWAALSTGGIKHLILPPLPQARIVTIFADHDAPGLQAGKSAATRWIQEGREVYLAIPPEAGTDFNDLLLV